MDIGGIMDKPRFGVARSKKIRRILFLVLFLLLASAATYGLSKLRPAARSVEKATLYSDKVKHGSLLLDIHGTGTLVPEDFTHGRRQHRIPGGARKAAGGNQCEIGAGTNRRAGSAYRAASRQS